MHLTSFTHALAIVRAHAHVLAHCTHTEYTVRVLAHYALRSHARNLATVHHACEWQRASTRELLCNARARTFKTHYTAHIVLLCPLVLQVDGLSHLAKRVVALTDVRYGIQSGCSYVTESLD